ncbi:Tubulin tyrosine ligase-like 4A [Carabus blaptoides fortunei]
MSNKNFRQTHDDVNVVSCDPIKSYKSCQPAEKLCRFAYANWCPVCDLESHRRRSKSECLESHYRKRGRDMKTPSSKHEPGAENKELREIRLESSRVRTNLCELPTTYITNCQTNVPSNNTSEPYSSDIGKKATAGRNYRCLSPCNMEVPVEYCTCVDGKSAFLKDCQLYENNINSALKNKIIQAVKNQPVTISKFSCNCRPALVRLERGNSAKYSPNSVTDVRPSSAKVSVNSLDKSSHDERTKQCQDAKVPAPVDENSVLEPRRHRIRQRSDSDNTNDALNETQVTLCTVMSKKAREVSPLESKKELLRTKNIVKVASIKNRHKISVIKLRKVRSKIAHSVSSDSNFSDSEFSEAEESETTEIFKQQDVSVPLQQNVDTKAGCTPTNTCVPVAICDVEDKDKWPVRPSLFRHVPPYILFSAHDAEPFKLPPGVARFLKWRLSTITPVVVRKTLSNTGFRLVRKSNDWSGTWGKHIKSVIFQSLRDTQKLNHFPGTFQIGRKDRLWKNLQRLMFKYGQKEFGFIPRTFVLPHDLKLLRQAWEKTGNEKWIIKPPASARGTGIKVIHRWAHLPKKKSLVVQQYIANPYLINGSKFDLRLYVLVTSFNPLRIYLYPDGLARFASTAYSDDLNTLSDRYMHLTNYSINKLSSQYTANEDANACKGHKWTLSKLWEFLEKDGVNTKALWRSLQQLVIKTILCGESSISQLYKANVNSRYNCYELFGVDVLLDDRLKPWLLEVNISPSLHSASPLDLHVKGPLVQMLLNLAQFHFPPKLARVRHAPATLNTALYTTQLTTKERLKQMHFTELESREEYLNDILHELTGDDIRHLTQAEDELTVIGNFERVFPTQHTHHYQQFMEVRYYNRLFDAWETRYERNRSAGVKLLQTLCEQKLHLTVPHSPVNKSSSNETDGAESSAEGSVSDESADQTTSCSSVSTAESQHAANVTNVAVQYNMMKIQ